MFSLKGHAVLVTGSSKGVGRSMAESCAKAGADVIVQGRQLGDDAKEVMDNCAACGVKAAFVAGDLSGHTETVVDEVFQAAIEANPGVDLLINNAGQYFDLPFTEMTHDRFDKTMRLNVASAYFLTQRFANHWIAKSGGGDGRVIMCGSINGQLAEVDSTAYDISKGAIDMMVKTLAVALAPHHIRVNGLAPGLVRTYQTRWLDERKQQHDWMVHHTPSGQIPHSDVCGPGAVYLLSDEAEHVHGHMLLIDGGIGAWQQPPPGDWHL